MMRRTTVLVLASLAVVLQVSSRAAVQSNSLTVRAAAPAGEIGQLIDASEIRITFSEPMVALGGAVTGRPSWITITPALNASYYWNGTTTLLVSPLEGSRVRYSTRYEVTIDRTATSTAGRSLAAPYVFSFTTPTPRLLSAQFYRRTRRYDSPAVIALRFNQPMRAADVVEHTRIALSPYEWRRPIMSDAARDRLSAEDPAGLARFDQKVAAVTRIAASTDPIPFAAATAWDETRFPPSSDLVVVETTTPPPSGARLSLTLDARLPGAEGAVTHAAQSTTVQMEQAFFVSNFSCQTACDPAVQPGLSVSAQATLEALTKALSVRDITGNRTVPIARDPAAAARPASTGSRGYLTPQEAGFPRQPPLTRWLLRLDGAIEAADGQTLGYPWMGIVETTNEMPVLMLGGSVWESGNGTMLPLFSRNVLSVTTRVQAIDTTSILARLRPMAPLRGQPTPVATPTGEPVTRRLTITPNAAEAHPFDLRSVLSPQGKGVVLARIEEGDVVRPNPRRNEGIQTRTSLVQVTNLGVTVKDSPRSTLVFVSRLDNAAPVAGARVAIVGASNQQLWTGDTGADGVAIAPALPIRPQAQTPTFLVTAEKDGDLAFVASDWAADPQPWRLGYPREWNTRSMMRGSVFTDRGVYKQGDAVRVKAVVRTDDAAGAALVAPNTELTMRLRDSRGRDVDQRTIVVGPWGSVDFEWQVPATAALGYYSLSLQPPQSSDALSGTASGSFLVAAYRAPDFRVDATMEGDAPAVLGSTLRAGVEAQYLFGSPLRSRPVRWWVRRNWAINIPAPIRNRYPDDRFAFGYMPTHDPAQPFDGRVTDGVDQLDTSGHLQKTVKTEPGSDAAFGYQFGADVEGESGQHIAGNAHLVVHPSSIYVGVRRPSMFVDINKPMRVEVAAANLDGSAARVPVTMTLFRREWTPVMRPQTPGSSSWEQKDVQVGRWQVTTPAPSATPRAADTPETVALTMPVPDAGSYLLRATATDSSGRPTRTDLSFYAFGRGRAAWKSEGNVIDLVPERQTWRPGESARILIQSPWERATALLTTEREGVRSHRQFAINSTQDVVEVPVTAADAPNVYVSVMLIKGRTATDIDAAGEDHGAPAFRVGYTEIQVDDPARRLRVEVSSDQTEYRPKQMANVSVAVTDVANAAAPSEVTLWAVDYGLLSLTGYSTPDVLRAIYARRPLQVQTEETRARLIPRRTMRTAPEGGAGQLGQGGGGGRGGMAARALDSIGLGNAALAESVSVMAGVAGGVPAPPPPPASPAAPGGEQDELRTDFRPVVFWLASLPTDAAGRASTTVTLPDSLTTYRIMAIAGDRRSRFGSGEREIRATKPVTLLPAFPRFMSVNDRASFTAVLTNSTPAAGNAVVTIRTLDPGVLQFTGEQTRTYSIGAGASEPVRFDANALTVGRARVQMTVTIGGNTDAFELTVPVTAATEIETTAAYGDTTSRSVERIMRPSGAMPGSGGLSISLASTALVGLAESAKYLEEYPYECAEQKASRALALVLSSDLNGAFGFMGADPASQRTAATRAFDELIGYQCPDGGFTMWPGRCEVSNAYLTAYVLHVMQVAGTLKVAVDRTAIDRALGYLQNQLRQQVPGAVQGVPAWGATQAFAVKVLSELGRNVPADRARLASQAERLPVFALSYVADAYAAANDRGPVYQDLVRRLTNALRVTADRAFLEEIDDPSLVWLWNTNVRATAVVLDGFARRRDQLDLTAPLARWLIAVRENGRWRTTHENGMALEALVSYYRAMEPDVPDMTASVSLAGKPIGDAQFRGRSTTSQDIRLTMSELAASVTAASADLAITRTGTGRLYYTTRMQTLRMQPAESLDRGIRLDRRYERYVNGDVEPASSSFARGDVVRITVAVTVPKESRFLAVNDAIPAGFEPIEGWFQTTASDLARVATTTQRGGANSWLDWYRRGGFDHIEKHDDRVLAFATRLGAGRHEFSYLARATSSGEFRVAGTRAEEMYAPEVTGRGTATTVVVR